MRSKLYMKNGLLNVIKIEFDLSTVHCNVNYAQ